MRRRLRRWLKRLETPPAHDKQSWMRRMASAWALSLLRSFLRFLLWLLE